MDFDEYSRAIARINNELQSIADRTAGLAMGRSANPTNPMFIELMQRHLQLIKLSSELTERMLSPMKNIDS